MGKIVSNFVTHVDLTRKVDFDAGSEMTMKAFEFQTQLKPGNILTVPGEIAEQLPPEDLLRVILLIAEEEDEEREWIRFGMEQFLRGYAESDAIYDQLSSGAT